jgi:uncharacterized protein (DUF58 family)
MFLSLIAVIFAVGAIKGLNLIYLIASLMISLMFISSLLPLIGLHNLSFERQVPASIFANKPFPVELLLTNGKKSFCSYSMAINDILENQDLPQSYIIKIPPNTTISAAYEHTIPRRGVYAFDGTKVMTLYPLDFFSRGFVRRKEEKIIVYPKIVKLNPNFLADLMTEIEVRLNRPGIGTEVYGFRKYEPGDDTRNINWKITAKSSEVTVTKFSQEQNLHIAIVFDNGLHSTIPDGEKTLAGRPAVELEWFESAVTFVASISSFFIEKGYKVKLVTQSGETGFGEGTKQLYQVLRHLAVIQPIPEPEITKDLYHPSHLEQKLGILITCEKKDKPMGHFIHTFHARSIEEL